MSDPIDAQIEYLTAIKKKARPYDYKHAGDATSTSTLLNPTVRSSYSALGFTVQRPPPVPPKLSKEIRLFTVSNESHQKTALSYLACCFRLADAATDDDIMSMLGSAFHVIHLTKSAVIASKVAELPIYNSDGTVKTMKDEDGDDMVAGPYGVPVPPSDLSELRSADVNELAAYFGMLSVAIGRQPRDENITAFNEKRRGALTSVTSSDEWKIFVDGSDFLTISVLKKINRVFSVNYSFRARFIAAAIEAGKTAADGPQTAFKQFFSYNRTSGLGIISMLEAVQHHIPGWIDYFPELHGEFRLVQLGVKSIMEAPEDTRDLLKVMHGNKYVPFNSKAVSNLHGVARYMAAVIQDTFGNFAPGRINDEQRNKCDALLMLHDIQAGGAKMAGGPAPETATGGEQGEGM